MVACHAPSPFVTLSAAIDTDIAHEHSKPLADRLELCLTSSVLCAHAGAQTFTRGRLQPTAAVSGSRSHFSQDGPGDPQQQPAAGRDTQNRRKPVIVLRGLKPGEHWRHVDQPGQAPAARSSSHAQGSSSAAESCVGTSAAGSSQTERTHGASAVPSTARDPVGMPVNPAYAQETSSWTNKEMAQTAAQSAEKGQTESRAKQSQSAPAAPQGSTATSTMQEQQTKRAPTRTAGDRRCAEAAFQELQSMWLNVAKLCYSSGTSKGFDYAEKIVELVANFSVSVQYRPFRYIPDVEGPEMRCR